MHDAVEPALRFVHYAVMLGLFGWTGFRAVGLRGLAWLPDEGGRSVVLAAAVLAPLVSVALMAVSIAAMMGAPLAALDRPMVAAMTVGTDMGWAFFARVALLVTAAVALAAGRGRASPAVAACYAAALVTLGWNGHAASTEGVLGTVHRVSDGVHLIAGGLWLGAIGWFAYLTRVAHRVPGTMTAPLLAAMHRFFPMGVALVALVAVTGLVNAQLIVGVANVSGTLMTGYGQLLGAKIALVAGMLALGAHNARVGRRAAHAIGDPAAALRSVRRSLARELTLGVGVVALVAVLGMLSPATT